jgi:hypothetical protein
MDDKRKRIIKAKEDRLFKDKRKKRSFWMTYVSLSGYLNVLIGVIVIMIIDSWAPKSQTFLDRLFQVNRDNIWTLQYGKPFVALVAFMLFHSSVALFINARFLKRKTDHLNGLVVVGFIFSWALLIIFYT